MFLHKIRTPITKLAPKLFPFSSIILTTTIQPRTKHNNQTKSAPCEGTCVVLTDLERHRNGSEPEEWRMVARMYVEKDLPVQLFGGGTTLNRAQRSSTRRRERRRKNVQEPTPTSSTITFSLPSSYLRQFNYATCDPLLQCTSGAKLLDWMRVPRG
ncbi:hypothetical protein K443DRAFT_687113 [Laccaria amethystina LaAM-08-1]|uniref:Uncharacterized protein n=1 Tax=Laccaria amethystina LaAM-08-1 TaxID=1095629 RepID=A0A0C9WGQ0_9AGAR|nr:hypothetical protein K443DRAFT_687113 [Laccaria amethystina LaAM-08-1]